MFFRKAVEAIPSQEAHLERKNAAMVLFAYGESLAASGHLQDALSPLLRALHYDPTHPITLTLVGTIAVRLGDNQRAEAYLRTAVKSRVPYPGAFKAMGTLLMHQKRYEEAKTMLKQAAELAPQDSQASLILADAFLESGDISGAISYFSAVVKRNPLTYAPFLNLGRCLLAVGNAKESIPFLERAANLKEDSWMVHSSLGAAYFQIGDFTRAATRFARAVRLNPEDKVSQEHLQAALKQIGHQGLDRVPDVESDR